MSELPDPQAQLRIGLEQEVVELGKAVAEAILPGVGFCLILADFGDGGNMAYMSNGDRSGMIGMLAELLVKMGGSVPELAGWSDDNLNAWARAIAAVKAERAS